MLTGKSEILKDIEDLSAAEIFDLILDNEMLDYIVTETDRYAQQFIESHPDLKPKSRAKKWRGLTKDDFRKWLGLTFLMGINSKPRVNLHWSTNKLYASGIFPAVMSRDR